MDKTVFNRENRQWRSSYSQTNQRTAKAHGSARGRKSNIKKSDCHIHATLKQRLDAVYKLRLQYTVKTLCRALKVNRSTYYKHFYSKPAPRTCENQVIRKHILQIYSDYDNSLGAYKIRRVLERDYGINISLGRVYRLMNTMNLPKRSTEKPKWKYSHKGNDNCFNHLNQQFNPSSPNSVWASDFTYIKVNGSFHYLCVVMDLFSRKIIGWSISNRHDVNLTIKAFKKAYLDRGEPEYILFHSDRGSEYTAFTFRQILERYNVVQSFSQKGYPYDNACLESFFHHMKRECINRKTFRKPEELRLCCFEYINRYNTKRPHSSLGDYTPDEIESFYMERQ